MTQEKAILKHLLSGKELTSIQAIELFGVTRLSALIFNLRQKGYDIRQRRQTVNTRYGRHTSVAVYWLEDPKEVRE